MFSKSFGYAVRGILYIVAQGPGKKIMAGEVATQLKVPAAFMSKILKMLVHNNLLGSTKGPFGGFYATEKTAQTTVLQVLHLTDGDDYFTNCALRLHRCNNQNPCPLHNHLVSGREAVRQQLASITVEQLTAGIGQKFLQSLVTEP